MPRPYTIPEHTIEGNVVTVTKVVKGVTHVITLEKDVFDYIVENKLSMVVNRKYVKVIKNVKQKLVFQKLLHRLTLGLENNDGKVVDHRDRNPYNNVRSNLRLVTHEQNAWNLSLDKRSTTGYRGVHQRKDNGKYMAYFSYKGEKIYIGTNFMTAEEANKAVIKARADYYGEYAGD